MGMRDELKKVGFDRAEDTARLYNHNLFILELALKIEVAANPGLAVNIDNIFKTARKAVRFAAMIDEPTPPPQPPV